MDRSKAHQVVRITTGGLMGPGPIALEKANEYISEAEHQDGDHYWDQFDYEAELADDVALYLKGCGYLGDGISGAGGNSHPLVGLEPHEPKSDHNTGLSMREYTVATAVAEIYQKAVAYATEYVEGALEAEDDFASMTICERVADFEMYLGERLKDL